MNIQLIFQENGVLYARRIFKQKKFFFIIIKDGILDALLIDYNINVEQIFNNSLNTN